MAAGGGGIEALAGGDDKDRAATNLEEEWATICPNALLANIIFCNGGDSGVMFFWWHGQGPNEG
jgi:hypothetical protein